MKVLLLIFILIFLFSINYIVISRDILFPSNISLIVLVFILCIFGTQIFNWKIHLNDNCFFAIIAYTVLFMIGAMLGKKTRISRINFYSKGKESNVYLSDRSLKLIVIMQVFVISYHIYAMFENTHMGFSYAALTHIKESYMENSLGVLFKLAGAISNALTYIAIYFFLYDLLIDKKRCKRRQFFELICIILYNVDCLVSSSRYTFMVEVFYIVLIVRILFGEKHGNKVREKVFKLVFKAFVVVFFGFILIGIITQRITKENSLFDVLSVYTSSSIYGLNYFLNEFQYDISEFGTYSFNNIYRIFNMFGIYIEFNEKIFSPFYEIVSGKIASNLYTGYRQLLYDFGYIGTGMFAFLYGLCSAVLFEKSIRKNTSVTFRIIVSSIAYLYIMIWLDQNPLTYLLSMSTITQVVFIIIFCNLLLKKHKKAALYVKTERIHEETYEKIQMEGV